MKPPFSYGFQIVFLRFSYTDLGFINIFDSAVCHLIFQVCAIETVRQKEDPASTSRFSDKVRNGQSWILRNLAKPLNKLKPGGFNILVPTSCLWCCSLSRMYSKLLDSNRNMSEIAGKSWMFLCLGVIISYIPHRWTTQTEHNKHNKQTTNVDPRERLDMAG